MALFYRSVAALLRSALCPVERADELIERALMLQGRAAARDQAKGQRISDLRAVEFSVFSQWGEDGIIEWLVAQLQLPNHRFIEFGVESFVEANCRFLLQNRNWKGLVMDGSELNIQRLRASKLHWMHDLTAKSAFITAENINALIEEVGFAGPLGLLSIDIDGNDYWVWKAISVVDPAIVICEYNAILGDTRSIVVPYAPDFRRLEAHHSGLYYGASIMALRELAAEKGYTCLGSNANGINAFFVRNDLAKTLLPLIAEQKAFPSHHRDSRGPDGKLTFARGLNRLALISDMPVIDIKTGDELLLGGIAAPYSEAWLEAVE